MIKRITRKKNREHKIGGDISADAAFSKILSIGYEFECGNMFAVREQHDSNGKYYYIPRGYETEELIHNKQCVPKIGNYSCLISYETDTPHAGNTTKSLLTVYEDKLKSEPDNVNKLLEKCNLIGSINNLFITHTELLFTFFNKHATCIGFNKTLRHPINNPNCIQETFLIMLHLLRDTFVFSHEVVHNDMKIIFFRAPHISKPIFYGIPTTPDKNLTPQDIIWVPQMTYSVEPQNIMEVTERLSIHLDKEERDIIKQCIVNANDLFKNYAKWAKEFGLEKENPLLEIFKNVLFFSLYYIHPYFFYDLDVETEINEIHKNMFCFLFRHSVYEIFNFYKTKSLTDGTPYLIQIVDYLKTQIRTSDTTTHSDEPLASIERKWKSYVCSSFILLQDLQEYDTPLRFFGDIFSSESQYYKFTGKHVLIEFRCFHKNIIQSIVPGKSKVKDINFYKTLTQWQKIMNGEETSPKTSAKSKTKRGK